MRANTCRTSARAQQMVNKQLVPNFTDKVNAWFDYGRTGGYLRHCLDRIQIYSSGNSKKSWRRNRRQLEVTNTALILLRP